MLSKPNLLLINDDGIFAPGLKHLWKGLKEVGHLTIVAPSTERSGAGQSISMKDPLHLERVEWYDESPAWSITGTPADCVKIALGLLCKTKPDLIISGINPGSNAGRNIFYSGTVGGVIEGVMQGIPGAAISSYDPYRPFFDVAEKHVSSIAHFLLRHPFPSQTFLNVTFPPNCDGGIKGFQLARQGQAYWHTTPEGRQHPEGFSYYWLIGRQAEFDEHEESDISLLQQGYMTAVPVHVGDLTHHALLEQHRRSFAEFFLSPSESGNGVHSDSGA